MLEERSILQLPIDELGLEVLRDFDRTGQWNDYNYVNGARNAGYSKPALNALSEAIGWLRARGLVTPSSHGLDGSCSMRDPATCTRPRDYRTAFIPSSKVRRVRSSCWRSTSWAFSQR
jgi:hypothetical protein